MWLRSSNDAVYCWQDLVRGKIWIFDFIVGFNFDCGTKIPKFQCLGVILLMYYLFYLGPGSSPIRTPIFSSPSDIVELKFVHALQNGILGLNKLSLNPCLLSSRVLGGKKLLTPLFSKNNNSCFSIIQEGASSTPVQKKLLKCTRCPDRWSIITTSFSANKKINTRY